MKKWILSASLVAGAVGLAGCGAGDDVVATSKAGDVTQQELYDSMKEKYSPQMEQALQEVMYKKVLSEKYEVSDKEVDKELKKAKEQLGPQYEAFLAQYNLDEKGFKDFLKLELLREKAALSDIKVTDKEVKEYYDKWQPPMKIRHILVEDEKKAKEVEDKLAKGEKFDALAKEYSSDPGSAQNGGDLGWVDSQSREQFVPEFSKALDTLKKGEISKPVKSDLGFHIIEITDMKEKKPFKDMKPELTKELKQSKADPETIQKKLDKELKAADVKVKDEDLKGAFGGLSDSDKKSDKEEEK
ncbi:peptidylprolyl isomerase [Pseudobacillus badius]|uniref:peptidylprolyl isomerase n=1 Tax=Bacillus badius TaxID=1455 RepID=UPI0007B08760|nr:peptidylprolyl isomerase [Bacillus badius]KZO01171.1 peptidylprolyl isomerase [Bacillus badius]MED0667683.1 peptidylprolyl isomerase [Bacillus badius]OCS89350.1 peptidylprolyl isomerase [Bacillus badius]OVE51270.1 peptidylprolyl isomerase [Bacillus badius]TDW02267.1 foldase protein PrsA [Bacillus badius]